MSFGQRLFLGVAALAMIAVTFFNLRQARRSGQVAYGHILGRRLLAYRSISPGSFRAAVALNVFIFFAGAIGLVWVVVA